MKDDIRQLVDDALQPVLDHLRKVERDVRDMRRLVYLLETLDKTRQELHTLSNQA